MFVLEGMKAQLNDHALFSQRVLIDGVWKESASGAVLSVNDPATGSLLGNIPNCDANDTRLAIEAAQQAFLEWKRRPVDERADLLERWHGLILDHKDDLAVILTSEQGKPLSEARAEIVYAASFVKWFAQECRRSNGYMVGSSPSDRRILVLKEAVGVCGAITPWNFPAAMLTRKAAPALAAGCTMICKPSELTPFTALALGELAQRAGFPAGVLNIVTGLPEAIGTEMTTHPALRKISFTGSTRIGAQLMAQCAGDVKRLSLELGGNAPFIIFDDADIDLAIDGAMMAKFRNAGQTCVSANRFLVQAGIHDRFVARIGEAVQGLKVGNGREEGTTIGPLISWAAAEKVRAIIRDALEKGGSIAAATPCSNPGENFVSPIVIVDATTRMRLAQEEIFGPVAAIFRFEDEAEAIALANGTPFGLAAYFYTRSIERAWRLADRLKFGMVGLNSGTVSIETAPFGGVKCSGVGREGGLEGLAEYLDTKAVHWGGLSC